MDITSETTNFARLGKILSVQVGITATFPSLEPEYKLLSKDLPVCTKNGAVNTWKVFSVPMLQ